MACAILAIACKNNQDNGWFTMDYTNWIGTHRFLTRKSVISWPTINNNDHVGFVFSTMKVELFPGLDSLLERNYLWQRRNLNMSLFGDDRFTKQSISHVTIFIDFLFFIFSWSRFLASHPHWCSMCDAYLTRDNAAVCMSTLYDSFLSQIITRSGANSQIYMNIE